MYRALLLVENIVNYLLLVIGKIFKRIFLTQGSKQLSILIKNLGGIGDYILLSSSFPGYRKRYPHAKIVLMVRREVGDLAIYNPYIDSLISVNYESLRRSLFEKLRVWYVLLCGNFDITINTDYSPSYEMHDSNIIQWSMASRKIAFECLDRRGQNRNYSLYDEIVPQDEARMFEIDRNNEMLKYLGIDYYNNHSTCIWGLDNFKTDNQCINKLIGTKYYVIFPGSLQERKCWNTDNFSDLINKLAFLGYASVICGSKKESIKSRKIINRSKIPIIDLTGQTDLMELSLLIQNAYFMVTNDSAPAHIGGAVKTQTFIILGGGHYGRFFPYPQNDLLVPIIKKSYMDCFNCEWKCKYDNYRCIQEISVEDVLSTILSKMSCKANNST